MAADLKCTTVYMSVYLLILSLVTPGLCVGTGKYGMKIMLSQIPHRTVFFQFTGIWVYHAFLSLLPHNSIKGLIGLNQIDLNWPLSSQRIELNLSEEAAHVGSVIPLGSLVQLFKC